MLTGLLLVPAPAVLPAQDDLAGLRERLRAALDAAAHVEVLDRVVALRGDANLPQFADALKEFVPYRAALVTALAAHRERTVEIEAWGATLLHRLRAFASARALDGAPAQLVPPRRWDRWRKQILHLLPPSLDV